MKRFVLIILSIFLCAGIVGCGNSTAGTSQAEIDEYTKALYKFYLSDALQIESLTRIVDGFSGQCEKADSGDIALGTFSTEGIISGGEKLLEEYDKSFIEITSPPIERQEGFNIAEGMYTSFTLTFETLFAAYSDATPGTAHSYALSVERTFEEYLKLLVELGDYFDEIGYSAEDYWGIQE